MGGGGGDGLVVVMFMSQMRLRYDAMRSDTMI